MGSASSLGPAQIEMPYKLERPFEPYCFNLTDKMFPGFQCGDYMRDI